MKIYHTKSGKSKDAIDKLVQKFKDGDLSGVTMGIKFQVPEQFPSHKYSYRNKIMAYYQLDSIITGSSKFWKDNGRKIKKGSKAGYIFAPLMAEKEDDDGNKSYFPYAYKLIPTFNIEQTEEIRGFEGEVIQAPELEPADLPPLLDIAEELGLKVDWKPVPMDRWADYWKKGERINMGTDSPAVFFHELCHALHEEVEGDKFKTLGTDFKEVVAEFGAAVLMDMYLDADHSGNAWQYIKMFADNPTEAVERSLMMIQRMFTKLEELTKESE